MKPVTPVSVCVCVFFLFTFLAKVDHYLSVRQMYKKSVRGSILGADVLEKKRVDAFDLSEKVSSRRAHGQYHNLSCNADLYLIGSLLGRCCFQLFKQKQHHKVS